MPRKGPKPLSAKPANFENDCGAWESSKQENYSLPLEGED